MHISVIVSTYNRPDALLVVLRGYARSSFRDFEVIIADDGSVASTREAVERWSVDSPYPVQHVYQPDEGFRLAAVRNLALRAMRGSVAVFTDGDCVPLESCLELHAARCAPGRAHAGERLLLTESETTAVLEKGCLDELKCQTVARRERWRLWTRWAKNRVYCTTGWKPRPKLVTANACVHREDLERVNGFDERFVGWGYEDEDLARRLRRTGVRVADGTRDCHVVHLFHPVHESHRPSARGSPNYTYFRRSRYLTRPLRGWNRRTTRDLALELQGDVPAELRGIARTASDRRPEVTVRFGRTEEPARGAVVLEVAGRAVPTTEERLYRFLEEELD